MQTPPTSPEYKVSSVEGLPFLQGGMKAICFLEHKENKFVNAKTMFSKSKDDVQKAIRYGIQQWLQGVPAPKRHHGWNQSQHGGAYTNCYVFKHVAKGVRFYGCLHHPVANGRALICCVIHYAIKREDEVDTYILDDINQFLAKDEFKAALEGFWNELQSKQGDVQ
ncbi:MAG TPA: hypothetical protein VIG33_08170 [Pseudobdellovibrionaceae bacterium]|jgi:hypothetical protein